MPPLNTLAPPLLITSLSQAPSARLSLHNAKKSIAAAEAQLAALQIEALFNDYPRLLSFSFSLDCESGGARPIYHTNVEAVALPASSRASRQDNYLSDLIAAALYQFPDSALLVIEKITFQRPASSQSLRESLMKSALDALSPEYFPQWLARSQSDELSQALALNPRASLAASL